MTKDNLVLHSVNGLRRRVTLKLADLGCDALGSFFAKFFGIPDLTQGFFQQSSVAWLSFVFVEFFTSQMVKFSL